MADVLPIVDTHLHFLDLARFAYPWTEHPDFASLRRDYLPQDWQADAGEREVLAGVHVQAEVDHAIDPAQETAWLASLPEPVAPMVHVAYADLRAADLDDVLARHRAHPAVRGIRQEAWFDPQSTRADIPRVNLLSDPTWRAGLARLPVHGLSFDLLVWPHQLVHAAEIFAALPQLAVVVEHTGLPPLGDAAGMQLWRDGLARFAATVPHAVLKISAMAFIASGWTTGVVGPIVREALEIFGPQRCMLGSNFPVDRGAASYAEIWSGYEQITADLSAAERTALFSGTALRTYHIDLAS
ncbi:MAG TPA: amidohydrolase family protein [Conexibacter sp.]|jgi:predicted TIM-barrel fold metal-dependent hydrolase|nr:amidohydrolase family protein [Conexibacter sp.]